MSQVREVLLKTLQYNKLVNVAKSQGHIFLNLLYPGRLMSYLLYSLPLYNILRQKETQGIKVTFLQAHKLLIYSKLVY